MAQLRKMSVVIVPAAAALIVQLMLFVWSGVVALAGVLLCYGTTELAEGYGFIAVAVMGLVLRRVEPRFQQLALHLSPTGCEYHQFHLVCEAGAFWTP